VVEWFEFSSDCFCWNLQNTRDDVFDLGELLSTFSRQQVEDFWSSLTHKCASALLHMDEDDVTFDPACLVQYTHMLTTHRQSQNFACLNAT